MALNLFTGRHIKVEVSALLLLDSIIMSYLGFLIVLTAATQATSLTLIS